MGSWGTRAILRQLRVFHETVGGSLSRYRARVRPDLSPAAHTGQGLPEDLPRSLFVSTAGAPGLALSGRHFLPVPTLSLEPTARPHPSTLAITAGSLFLRCRLPVHPSWPLRRRALPSPLFLPAGSFLRCREVQVLRGVFSRSDLKVKASIGGRLWAQLWAQCGRTTLYLLRRLLPGAGFCLIHSAQPVSDSEPAEISKNNLGFRVAAPSGSLVPSSWGQDYVPSQALLAL